MLRFCWCADFSHAWADRKKANMKCEYSWCMLQVYPENMRKVCHLPVLLIACKSSPVYFNAVFCDLLYITHLIYNFTFVMKFCYTVNFRLIFS